MIYLKSFELVSSQVESYIFEDQRAKMGITGSLYPYNIFPEKAFTKITFDSPITIFYGDNGSGKSTLLNIISEKLKLKRNSPLNKTYFFDKYLDYCHCYDKVPSKSKIITSDDVFNNMFNLRCYNQGLETDRNQLIKNYRKIKNSVSYKEAVKNFNPYNPKSALEFEQKMEIIKGSVSQYVKKRVELNYAGKSNGENALLYFFEKIEDNALYLLDEPENSLSPDHQMQLLEYIQNAAIGSGCQFIIATHSPFILSLQRAEIYDLDSFPVKKKKWTELRNVQVYRNFFKEHEKDFE
ncbi:MAG: AAA family ATPase [Treponema sp.]|nr:AAA family ATPase [Treponema sp.]